MWRDHGQPRQFNGTYGQCDLCKYANRTWYHSFEYRISRHEKKPRYKWGHFQGWFCTYCVNAAAKIARAREEYYLTREVIREIDEVIKIKQRGF